MPLLKKIEDMAELVEGLRAHVDDHAAALAACQAMACLTAGEQAEKAAAIARAGGIETVLAAGAKHAGSAQVAEQVCRVLRGLAYYTDDNKAAIAAAGGIEAVVRVMGEHQANAAVMEQACLALRNLAGLDANKARIAEAGGIEAVVRVLGEHQANAAVMERACWALAKIGWPYPALQKRIKDAGAEPLVRAAVAAPDATRDTKRFGQELLDKLLVCGCMSLRVFVCIGSTYVSV